MGEKYQDKYRIPSARLQNWDYRWAAAYFITICTQNRECYFGNVENGIMHLSQIGVIANIMWHEIKNHSENIELDAFVVMPNHVHGILILNRGNCDGNNDDNAVETGHALSPHTIATGRALSLPQSQPQTIGNKRFQNIGKNSVSSIIGSYKSAVSKHAHRLGYQFEWQTLFYDHIIKDNEAFNNIQTYILNNPLKWRDDTFHNQ